MLVSSPVVQPSGTLVRLEFVEFKAKGEVIWTEETDEGALLGLRLVSMGWQGWKTIRAFF